jgi:hypothetical protein
MIKVIPSFFVENPKIKGEKGMNRNKLFRLCKNFKNFSRSSSCVLFSVTVNTFDDPVIKCRHFSDCGACF